MKTVTRWYRRLGVLLAAALTGLLVPATAWADPGQVTTAAGVPLAKKAVAAAGGLAALCCLVVVAIIAGVIVMMVRRRRR